MSPTAAFAVITWVALVILYFGLAAVLREVRQLRSELTTLKVGAPAITAVDVTWPALAADPGQTAVVLVGDSACPPCLEAAAELGRLAPRLPARPKLLTYESPATWQSTADRLAIVQDRDAWANLAHLTPPLLLLVDAHGHIRELALLADGRGVRRTLGSWGFELAPERI